MLRPLVNISLTGIFALVAYLSLFNGSFDHIADDPGIGWHLKNGERIFELGEIPYVDPFLALPIAVNPYAPVGEGRPWVSDQWLSDLILHKVFALGGWPALYALVSGLFLVAYFEFAAQGVRRGGQGAILVLLALIFAFKLGQVHLIVRPVIFSITLFPLVLRRVTSLANRQDLSWGDVRRECLVLPPLFVVWANLHPAFVYGLLVVGICAFTRTIRDRRDGLGMAFLGIACASATLINPYGPDLHRSIVELGGSSYLRSMTTEWYPLNLGSVEALFLIILSIVPLSALVISRQVRRSAGAFEVLVAFTFVAQALWAVRVVPFAGLACLPLWATCFGSRRILPTRPWTALSGRVLSSVVEREARLVAPGLRATIAIGCIGGCLMVCFPEKILPGEIGSPYERALNEIFVLSGPARAEGVVLASLNWGGALAHVGGDRLRPVLDDRTVLVGEKLYRDYGESLRDPTVFQELVDVFGVNHTVLPAGVPLERYLSTNTGWSLVHSREGISVFSRR